jgi:hypothetical protein
MLFPLALLLAWPWLTDVIAPTGGHCHCLERALRKTSQRDVAYDELQGAHAVELIMTSVESDGSSYVT